MTTVVGVERVETVKAAPVRALAVTVPALLLAYAFFDKGFAWLHVPGTALFVGEAVLALGLLAFVTSTPMFTSAWRSRPVLAPFVAFVAWGAVLGFTGFPTYGISALQDSAIWYYALFALLVIGLLADNRDRLVQWVEGYVRIIPYLLAWSPIVLLFGRSADIPGPLVPDSVVPLLTHKSFNVAVQASIAVGVLWLVPLSGVSERRRNILATLALVVAGLAGTQSRGGFVAAALACGLAYVLHRSPVRQISSTLIFLLLIVGIAWATGLKYAPDSDREISVAQLFKNVSSVVSRDESETNLGVTVEFREQLWSRTIEMMNSEGRLGTGLGFGPNIAEEVGLTGASSLDNPDLRNPHNSHLNVLARMGFVGAFLWLVLWGVWFVLVLVARSKHWRCGRPFEAGVCGAVVVGAAATLLNAYFDPTLEGPQVAVWLWALFGIGVVLIPRRLELSDYQLAS